MLEAQEHYHQQSTTLRQAGFHQANQMYEETAEALANLAQPQPRIGRPSKL